MAHDPITYPLTLSDRRELCARFGIDLAKVPTQVTGGQLDARNSSVLFVEMMGGHRIRLNLAGRPTLAAAASAAFAQLKAA